MDIIMLLGGTCFWYAEINWFFWIVIIQDVYVMVKSPIW